MNQEQRSNEGKTGLCSLILTDSTRSDKFCGCLKYKEVEDKGEWKKQNTTTITATTTSDDNIIPLIALVIVGDPRNPDWQ
jgi:hypothetical protein